MEGQEKNREYRNGLFAAIGCMVLWGVLPAYWKLLVPISSWVIIIYRILLVFVSAMILALRSYSMKEIFGPVRRDWKSMLRFVAAGAIITLNWSIYIWAVNANHIVETSTGYYIEPIMVCLFGVFLFHEKLSRYKAIALALATVSVIILLVHFHQLPWISLLLALTFSVYSAIKKTVKQPPLLSLIYETMVFAPFALIAVFWLEGTGRGALASGQPYQFALLLLCGFVTAIPLALFAAAAQKITMFALGLVEYISPTISLMLGVLFYHEPVDRVQMLAIGIIWIGLVFFSYGEFRESRKG
ncbi:MAG: EamA family transporter RarD [Mogibacterium sp.]|nr:EamA family transporter RarD [Mogibacterium sp.]